jgi:branched-chain amino acid transport system substrate-binding protein
MRRWIFAALCTVLVLAMAMGASPESWAQQEPIKIGGAWPLTGLVAASGKDMLNGFELYLDSIARTMSGRKVEFIMEDTGGVPANALTKTRKLVERDRVHLVMVGLLATEGYAVRDYVTRFKATTLFPIVAADDLTQRVGSPFIIRTGWASSQPSHPFADYVFNTLRYRKVATIANDYAFGYEVVGGFQKAFEDLGGCVAQKIWNPLGTPDFGPFMAQIRRDVDAVFALEVGADAIRFMKQYEEFGLKARLPLVGGGVLTDESLLRGMGDEAIGSITTLQWSAALGTDHARRFVDTYRTKFGAAPSYYAESLYTTGRWIAAAVRRIGGKVEDKTALINALKAVELFDAPRGSIKLDRYNNPVHNVYVRRVEKVGGVLQNTVIHTYHAVSQFWTYDPQKFLQQPLYTRAFPALSACR